MTPAMHLQAADHALHDGEREYRGAKAGFWGKLEEAKKDLKAIPEGSPEFRRAKPLLAEVAKRERNREAAVVWATAGLLRANREGLAKKLEIIFLDQGMDVHATVRGKDKTTLVIKYVLMSRPLVYKLINGENNILQTLKPAGFKTVVFTDGYNESWSIKVD